MAAPAPPPRTRPVVPIQAVVFDCDGVLVDSEPISIRVGVSVPAELGWAMTEQEFARRFLGCSREHYDAAVAAGLGRSLEPGWETAFAKRYEAAFEAHLRPVDGVVALLAELDARGVRYGVASNSSRPHVERSLSWTGLADRFAGRVCSAEEVPCGKPAPDVYLLAAQRLGVPPHRCAVVEDSVPGVTAAIAAGMHCSAYTGGGLVPPDGLLGLGADVVSSMAELPPLWGLVPSRRPHDSSPEALDSSPGIDNALTPTVRSFSLDNGHGP